MPHLCAFGCKNTGVTLHIFPNPEKYPERFKAWVQIVGGKLESPSDYEFYKKKRICDIHFTIEHKNRFNRLNALAEPSFHLPGASNSQQSVNINSTESAIATSAMDTLGATSSQQSGNINVTESAIATSAMDTLGASSYQHSVNINIIEPATSAMTNLGDRNCIAATADIINEHNYSMISRSRRQMLQKGAFDRKPRYSVMQTRPLNTKMKYLRNEIHRLRKKGRLFRQRLANAEKLSNDVAFQLLTKHMTKPAQLFVHMQQQAVKKSKGRRFSIDQKVLSLSLFKKSPKCYRLLCNYFTLPSTRAMKRLLSQIKLIPGINPIIFEKIKNTLREKETPDRLCSLIFDEMSITPQIFYNPHKDELEGFASNRRGAFADHALVFMVKGVKRNFKQPIAYYFTSCMNKLELKNLLKFVIQHTLESGLIIVNTVCDQSSVNVGAINELVEETKARYLRIGKEWRSDMFHFKGKNIIPLYDTPHLIKGLRNNLLTKDLVYYIEGEKKTIKWEYFQRVYEADKAYGELRLLHKLTEEHVNPDKISKMRVKAATQLFSHSVAVAAEHLTARGDLSEDCRQLIDFTLLIDNLFDSLNVSNLSIPNGKIYKGPIRKHSPHHQLWQKAKKILSTVKYIKKNKVGNKIRLTETVAPSVTNLIKTIEGIESLWKVLSQKYGFDAMLTRNFNQDPVENFFGNIRSYGVRNIAPNSRAFEGAFKALMLNNFSTPHSKRANCEEDSNECLQNLKFFLNENIDTHEDLPENNVEIIHFNEDMLNNETVNDAGQSNYVCGWVLKKCLKNIVKCCQHCKLNLLENNTTNENNSFISAKEYENKKWLCYPSKQTECYFKAIQNKATSVLKSNVPKKGLKNVIISFLDIFSDCPFTCLSHKDILRKYFVNMALNVMINSWCRSVNRILAGKITYDGDDETKTAAQNYFNKHKKYKNRK